MRGAAIHLLKLGTDKTGPMRQPRKHPRNPLPEHPFASRRSAVTTALAGAVLLCLGSLGCDKGSDQATTPPTASDPVAAGPTPETSSKPGAQGDPSCRDWSDLDVASLPALPETPYTATLDHAWRTILEAYYDPTFGCRDWPELRTEYGQKLTEAKDEAQAYATMNAMLGELGQSHLAIVPPSKRVAGEPRTQATAGGTVPASLRLIDGELVVVDARRHGLDSKLPAGAKVHAIAEHEVAPALSSMREVWKREVEVAFHMRRTAHAWLSCEPGKAVPVKVVPPGKSKAKTVKAPCVEPELERLSMGNLKDVPVEFESKMLPDSKIGYISFNIWMVPLVGRIQGAMKELREQGMQALVLDLRGNPGGVGAMSVPVARVLLSESANLGDVHMREADQHFKVEAAEDPFTGPVAVLIDEGTASTSEIFAQAMQDLGRIKVYGASPSQGAALPSLIEELPGGAILQYVVADYHSPKGVAVEGRGVQPDVVVPEKAGDFANGVDPVLEAAKRDLNQSS